MHLERPVTRRHEYDAYSFFLQGACPCAATMLCVRRLTLHGLTSKTVLLRPS